jgi:hypothetical protein
MRLVKPNDDSRQAIVGQDAFKQLREVGSRLDYIVSRYGRLVMDVTEGRPLSDLRDSVELMNSQLGYVARRLQEMLLAQYEQQHGAVDADEAPMTFTREMAVASR